MDVKELGTVLGIWAHPDDESFLTAGIMATAVSNGQRVALITATKGEKGTPDPVAYPPEKMAEIRERELADSLNILGVKEHKFLGFIDGECNSIEDESALEKIEPIFNEVAPDTVFSFGPDGQTNHDDHKKTYRWAAESFKRWGKPGAKHYTAQASTEWAAIYNSILIPLGMYMGAPPPPTIPEKELDLVFKVEGELLDKKVSSLLAQASQVEGLIKEIGMDTFRQMVVDETFVLAQEK